VSSAAAPQKIKVQGAIVEMDGDEMTRYVQTQKESSGAD
jgi:hypothetical protein